MKNVFCTLDDVLQYEQPQPYIVKNDEYSDDFKIPVLTAGKSFIIGKTNENFGIYDKLPVIIFDDFTTASQFVNFKFKVKSSAMKILSVRHHSLDIKFFYYLMKTINCPHDTHKRYWISDYSQKEISLPPLAEQGRIVAKIEELFAGIDAGVENLKSVKNQIALYRQSVLKSFLSGFATDTLANHVDMCLGKMLDKEKNKGTLFPYLRNKNVRWKNFDLDDLLEMRFEESEEERYSIQRGDLVVCEGGEPGRCAVWENDNVIKFQKALHRLRPHDNMNVYFLMYVFMLNIQAKNWDRFFTGSTIKHLTGEALKNLQIPVPTLAEQERIVAEIESRFERADALETAVDRALNDAEKLKQAVLKKAFSGELVPQNPDDEPASVLLDRIRAERAAEQRANPKKGKQK